MFYRLNFPFSALRRTPTGRPGYKLRSFGLIREQDPTSDPSRNAARVREYLAPKLRIEEQDRRPRWRDRIDGFVLVATARATEDTNIKKLTSVSRCRGKRRLPEMESSQLNGAPT